MQIVKEYNVIPNAVHRNKYGWHSIDLVKDDHNFLLFKSSKIIEFDFLPNNEKKVKEFKENFIKCFETEHFYYIVSWCYIDIDPFEFDIDLTIEQEKIFNETNGIVRGVFEICDNDLGFRYALQINITKCYKNFTEVFCQTTIKNFGYANDTEKPLFINMYKIINEALRYNEYAPIPKNTKELTVTELLQKMNEAKYNKYIDMEAFDLFIDTLKDIRRLA